MGFLSISDSDPHVTPRVSTNATGSFAWGGKHEEALSIAEVQAILSFCRDEGYRQGWNEAVRDRVAGEGLCANLFQPSLLGGLPHAVFERSFQRGASDHGSFAATPVEDEAGEDASAWWDT